MIDDIDGKILSILQSDARTSNAEIARRLAMAPSAILERIRKLETRGLIEGYEARLNPKALDMGLLAFIYVWPSLGLFRTAFNETSNKDRLERQTANVGGFQNS